MKYDTMEIDKNDMVMIHHNIGAMPSKEVDKYSAKILPKLVSMFGKNKVAFFPVREGETWDFTIIKKT